MLAMQARRHAVYSAYSCHVAMTVAHLVCSLALGAQLATTACVHTTTTPPIQELGMQRVSPEGPATATNVADSTASVGCGDTMCAPSDLCIAIAIGQAQSAPTVHYECSAAPLESSSVITCAPPSGGRQSCNGNVIAPSP
jgi:hypothetical protein